MTAPPDQPAFSVETGYFHVTPRVSVRMGSVEKTTIINENAVFIGKKEEGREKMTFAAAFQQGKLLKEWY